MVRATSVLLLAALTSTARADAVADADAAFARGRDLMKAGKCSEACVQLEKSEELDPQLGTLFNLAQCDEKIGKLATALHAYNEVIEKDTNAQRRTFAFDLANKLRPRVPKLVVRVSGAPSDTVVRLDNRTIAANKPISLDLGSYTIIVEAPGMQKAGANVKISEEGRTTTIVVPLAAIGAEQAEVTQTEEATTGDDNAPQPAHSVRKPVGVALLVVGGATLAAGGVFGVFAMSTWKDAKAVCGSSSCATQQDADRANALRDTALSRARTANILLVAGGVVAATGIVLWATAPRPHEVSMNAFAGSHEAGIALSGSF